jgi:hypothetical protein
MFFSKNDDLCVLKSDLLSLTLKINIKYHIWDKNTPFLASKVTIFREKIMGYDKKIQLFLNNKNGKIENYLCLYL